MKKTVGLACLIVLLSLAARAAEIEKVAQICDVGICLYWWPKLPTIKGWHQDKEASMEYGADALAPDGFAFSNAVVVIYGTASYKPRNPQAKSLQMFIASDQQHFLASEPGVEIREVKPLATGDGKLMQSFTFSPKSNGNWEQVAYGEEGQYYLTFVLSARSRSAFQSAESTYREMIARYKQKI